MLGGSPPPPADSEAPQRWAIRDHVSKLITKQPRHLVDCRLDLSVFEPLVHLQSNAHGVSSGVGAQVYSQILWNPWATFSGEKLDTPIDLTSPWSTRLSMAFHVSCKQVHDQLCCPAMQQAACAKQARQSLAHRLNLWVERPVDVQQVDVLPALQQLDGLAHHGLHILRLVLVVAQLPAWAGT